MYLTSLIGDLGSGKTMLAVKYCLEIQKDIWSNIKLNIPNYHPLNQYHFAEPNLLPNNILILIDEIHNWFEARLSGQDLNIAGSNLLTHIRKTDTDVIGTAPLFSMIDKRFRLLSNLVITAQPRLDQDIDNFHYDYWYTRWNIHEYKVILYQDAEKYLFPKFNTKEKQESPNKSKMAFNIIRRNSNLLLEKTVEIYDDIIDQLEGNITKDNVEYALLLNGYYIGWSKYIYLYAKGMIKTEV